MFTRDYGNFQVTSYPELEDQIAPILSELGKITVGPHPVFTGPEYAHWSVRIDYLTPITVVDWAQRRLEGGLFLNLAGGGVFGVPIAKIRSAPKPGGNFAIFDFELALDGRDLRMAEHSPEKVIKYLHDFVEMAKIGYCYHFCDLR